MLETTTPQQDRALEAYLAQKEAVELTIDAASVLEWVRDTFSPEDVFSHDTLERWALNFGYADAI